jgi:hypothetical protein
LSCTLGCFHRQVFWSVACSVAAICADWSLPVAPSVTLGGNALPFAGSIFMPTATSGTVAEGPGHADAGRAITGRSGGGELILYRPTDAQRGRPRDGFSRTSLPVKSR